MEWLLKLSLPSNSEQMKKLALLLTSLFVAGLILPNGVHAQNGVPKEIKPLFTIAASTTSEQLEAIKSKVKEAYLIDFKYSLQRNNHNLITSLLLNLIGAETNINLSLSGDQPIKDIYIIAKPNRQLGIWSQRAERYEALRAKREKRRDSAGNKRATTMARLQSKIRKDRKGSKETVQEYSEARKIRQSNIRLGAASGTEPLYIINGERHDTQGLNALDNNQIDHINVLKGKKALEKYGEDGQNGVIEIEMKGYRHDNKTQFSQIIEINAQTTDAEIVSISKKLEAEGASFAMTKVKRNAKGNIIGYRIKFDNGSGSKINTSKQGNSQEISPIIIRYDPYGKISLKQ